MYWELLIIIAFCCLMVWLAWEDLSSLDTPHHVDLKGAITVTGVLGTFVGVLYGLIGFDTGNPRASLPVLLEGLRIAFITSVVGMAISIWLTRKHKKKKKGLHEQLREEFDGVKAELAKLPVQIQQESIGLHNLLREEFGGVKTELAKLPEQIREGAIEQIIAALEEVVRDFNNKLNEQFGENFKKLNEACKELVQWQITHVEVLEKTQQTIDSCRAAIEQGEKVLNDVASRYEEIHSIIEAINNKTQELEDHVNKFDTIFENAQDRLKEITVAFMEATVPLSGFAQNLKDELSEITTLLKDTGKETQDILNSQLQIVKELQQDLTNSFNEIGTSISKISEDFAGGIQTELSKIMSSMEHASKETQKEVNSQIQEVNKMHESLAVALTKMQNSFVYVTEEFAGSYNKFKSGIEEIAKQAMEDNQND